MSLLNDVINAALREPGAGQVGSSGASPLVDALRSLLAPKSSQARTNPEETHLEPHALEQLITQFTKGGYADVIRSWIGTGANRPIEPQQVGQALGEPKVQELASETGMSRQSLLEELSRLLPVVIDKLTPQGRVPGK